MLSNNIKQLAQILKKHQMQACTVESCTGGGIGKALTAVSGSSQWFSGGLITYSNQSKTQLANVPVELINNFGAVSKEVVTAMAKGALAHFSDSISIAVSGVAGPGGGSKSKPVGTVWIGCATKIHSNEYCVSTQHFLFAGNRDSIRQQTIEEAIKLGVAHLQNNLK